MIPSEIVEFLKRPLNAVAGTQRNLTPTAHVASGWNVDASSGRITCYISPGFEGELEASAGGPIAFTATVADQSTTTYQLKGSSFEVRRMNDEDRAASTECVERFAGYLQEEMGYPGAVIKAMFGEAEVAISFEVVEIFDQTPGPGAGKRIHPPEEG